VGHTLLALSVYQRPCMKDIGRGWDGQQMYSMTTALQRQLRLCSDWAIQNSYRLALMYRQTTKSSQYLDSKLGYTARQEDWGGSNSNRNTSK